MTRFYLIRHAEPMYSMVRERNLGKAKRDFVPLTSTGIEQAHTVSDDPKLRNIDLIISSPYTRAVQTAAIISRKLDVPMQVEFDLYEWTPDLHEEFRTYQELQEIHKEFSACNGAYPSGQVRNWETKASVVRRTESVLQRYLEFSDVAVVCHGMVISCLTDMDPDEVVPYCGIYETNR